MFSKSNMYYKNPLTNMLSIKMIATAYVKKLYVS